MANLQTSQNGIEQVTIDTNPVAGGYWTNAIRMRRGPAGDIEKMYFSIREKEDGGDSTITPILQFKGINDLGWTDYNNAGEEFVIGDVYVMDANAYAAQWRAGVKEGGRTSGSINIGFSW